MKLRDHLSNDQKKKLKVISEQLTKRDILELMGVNKDTYKKVRGKWKQR